MANMQPRTLRSSVTIIYVPSYVPTATVALQRAKHCWSPKHSGFWKNKFSLYREKGRFPSTCDSRATFMPLEFILMREQIISPSSSSLSCSINQAYMSHWADNLPVRHLHSGTATFREGKQHCRQYWCVASPRDQIQVRPKFSIVLASWSCLCNTVAFGILSSTPREAKFRTTQLEHSPNKCYHTQNSVL